MLSRLTKEDRQFWFSWSLLTGAGSIAAVMLLTLAVNFIAIPAAGDGGESDSLSLPLLIASLFVYAIPGALIGLGQWFELRNLLPRAGWWILATAIGWVIGFGIGNLAFAFLAGLPPLLVFSLPWIAVGLVTGIGQWLYLRLHWSNTTPWIVVAILMTVIGGYSWLLVGTLGGAIGWLIAGAVSGYALIILRDRALMS
ncbi:MAG: hypothetical protein WA996_09295 [Candidatus Promineifilaceae bacterium]